MPNPLTAIKLSALFLCVALLIAGLACRRTSAPYTAFTNASNYNLSRNNSSSNNSDRISNNSNSNNSNYYSSSNNSNKNYSSNSNNSNSDSWANDNSNRTSSREDSETVEVDCAACNGTGRVTCPACGGTGKNTMPTVSSYYCTFPGCNGKGGWDCLQCRGKGKVRILKTGIGGSSSSTGSRPSSSECDRLQEKYDDCVSTARLANTQTSYMMATCQQYKRMMASCY